MRAQKRVLKAGGVKTPYWRRINEEAMTNMTTPGRLRAELLVALQSQDWERLDQALEDLAEELGGEQLAQESFRSDFLPCASVVAREAFWREAMDEEQFERFVEDMAMASTYRLEANEYTLGKDYSFARREDGLRILIVNDRARSFLAGLYEPGKFASLSIILRGTDAN